MQYNNFHIQDNLLADLPELLKQYNFSENMLLLSDINSFAAYKLHELPINPKHHINLPKKTKATLQTAIEVGNIAKQYDAILAVGSGSINDMAKYAAHHAGIPYIIMASAPSMNGYIAANASLWSDGAKKSHPAKQPRALLADINVLKSAPKRMIAAGVADVLCRSSAQFDALLAKYYVNASYHSEIFAEMIIREQKLLSKINADEDFITELMDCLLYGGEAMTIAGSSVPASGAEHMMAHLLEELIPDLSEISLHGELVGVTTLITRQLQTNFLADFLNEKLRIALNPKPFKDCPLVDYFDEATLQYWQNEYEQKLSAINSTIDYQAMLSELQQPTFLSANDLNDIFQKIGGKTSLDDFGLSNQILELALHNARFTRNRFTILDL
jgi:glycerol-1-phosphate dehydrogenase [NAD(P)+]